MLAQSAPNICSINYVSGSLYCIDPKFIKFKKEEIKKHSIT